MEKQEILKTLKRKNIAINIYDSVRHPLFIDNDKLFKALNEIDDAEKIKSVFRQLYSQDLLDLLHQELHADEFEIARRILTKEFSHFTKEEIQQKV